MSRNCLGYYHIDFPKRIYMVVLSEHCNIGTIGAIVTREEKFMFSKSTLKSHACGIYFALGLFSMEK